VGDVRCEQEDHVSIYRRAELDDKRRVPGAGQSLGDPVLVPRGGREFGPERRVVQRDLTPVPAYMRDRDQARAQSGGIGPRRGRNDGVEVEDAYEDLHREDGDRDEHIAAREHGEDKTVRSVDVLVDCSEGCRTCLGCLDGGLELVQLAFKASKRV